MKRTYQLLCAGPTLIVSLPDNSPDLARAAAAGGAHALKTHINLHHDASGTHFGSLEQERPRLEAVLRAVNRPGGSGPALPVGIVPGVSAPPARAEVEALAAMGFDFIDTFAHCFPSWLLREERMTRVGAIDATYSAEAAASLAAVGIEVLEAAVIPHDGYGQPLSAADLALYSRLARAVPVPIIVPSQRRLEPHDVERIVGLGINGIMIGAIVTSTQPATLEAATREFRSALDRLAPR